MNHDLDALHAGQAAAQSIFPALKAADEARSDAREKLLWWTGFFVSLGGYAAGSLGPGALAAIEKMTSNTVAQMLEGMATNDLPPQ